MSQTTRLLDLFDINAESLSTLRILDLSTFPSSSRIRACTVRSTTGLPDGFRKSLSSAYGYMISRTLKSRSSPLAMPSSVDRARALLMKYGGRSKRNRGTRRDRASRSLSNLSTGMPVVASPSQSPSTMSGYRSDSSNVISSASASADLSFSSSRTSCGISISSPNKAETASTSRVKTCSATAHVSPSRTRSGIVESIPKSR